MSERSGYWGDAVCSVHFLDPALSEAVRAIASCEVCDFCHRKSGDAIAAPVEEVATELVLPGILLDYGDATECLPWQGGYQLASTWMTDDILAEIGLELDDDKGRLGEALEAELPDIIWCKTDPFRLSPSDALRCGWRDLCNRVKHDRRFFFQRELPADIAMREEEIDDVPTPARLLSDLLSFVTELGMIRSTRLDPLYRARSQKPGEFHNHPTELGPPLPSDARANRMSPAGIVMMYLSDEAQTAVNEISMGQGSYAIGRFEFDRPATLLDLTAIPETPSRFDRKRSHHRHLIMFLEDFRTDMLKPVERDGREHVEYVPSQVVTEFLRTTSLDDGKFLEGIVFDSAVRPGSRSFVLFVDRYSVSLAATEAEALEEQERLRFRMSSSSAWIRMTARSEIVVSGVSEK